MAEAHPPRAALLPLYLKLYDDLLPKLRADFEGYISRIAAGFRVRGIDIEIAPVCRVAAEFDVAIAQFHQQAVDCIVTLHLAYSPSLEAIDALCRTALPIVILDATMDADFGLSAPAARIMHNHGVHGVMDLASVLRRRGRRFEFVAGHDANPRTLDRAADHVRAAVAARELRGSRVLRVGEAFAGMGDFAVADDILAAKLGIVVRQIDLDTLDRAVQENGLEDVAAEVTADRGRYSCELPAEAHERSVRVGLGLRRLLDTGGHSATSVNFQAFDRADRPASTMPFLEISKAMGRGIGYAGEGDVLTAALVGSLARGFGAVTFTEIFCPDWLGGRLFLSHMGEISPSVAAGRPRVIAKPLFSGGSLDPAVLVCSVKPGPAVFVNLAPGPGDSFSLIVAPVEVIAEDGSLDPSMRDVVRCWVRPNCPLETFLEDYSRAGGTHHSVLVLGDRADAVAAFGRMGGLDVVRIG